MAARHTDTREAIVRIGTQLIKSHGYNAFSYADISEQLQIKNAAVHIISEVKRICWQKYLINTLISINC